jgi:GTP-binding protein|tara:strand:- start:31 stop:630 length:600 start_codon:yes stop_codon:yes gene_type:complete
MNNTYFNNAKFIGSYPSTEDLPVDQGSEIAFCGRSNCGKSSILNALTNNKKLAKTSKTPGRTQSINVFEIKSNSEFKIIDLPGYGYAKVSKKMRASWGQEIEKYLMTRQCLNALCIIMDIRHPFKDDDESLIDWCESKDLPMILLLNKADKLSKSQIAQTVLNATKELNKLSTEHFIIPVSATKKTGINLVLEKINEMN